MMRKRGGDASTSPQFGHSFGLKGLSESCARLLFLRDLDTLFFVGQPCLILDRLRAKRSKVTLYILRPLT